MEAVLQTLLRTILEQPGATKRQLCGKFQLSGYRLEKSFRTLEQVLTNRVVVNHPERGIWLVEVDRCYCLGMDWVGPECGGWRQCRCRAEYGDHRCGEHTDYESPELVAFKRKLAYLTGMGEPNSLLISQMNLEEAEELLAEILSMTSVTRKDRVDKLRLITMIRAAVALMKFRAQSRRRVIMDDWIPPGARDAHRRSSGNSYEFVIRKHFLVLELQPEADRDEVLRAWKRLARQFHPDTGSGNEERMKEINAAKEKIFRIRRWD